MNYESFDRFNFRPRRPQKDAEYDITDSSDGADFVKQLRRALEDNAKGKRYFNLSLPRFMPKSMPQELKDKDPRYLRDETLQEFLDFYVQNDQLLEDFMLAFVFDKHAMGDPDDYKRYYDLETERSKYEAVFETEKLFLSLIHI